ncbi:hypothetical protein [Enterobacter hormaechei]|uniref:hypothetical protein n=1 Tax=Enterobacter hormaechei TaxID=158836 RepID=UPI0026EB6243|nr:hypothetical protein [Enterobacter hormaechei]
MVIGQTEEKACPICGSDATWTNQDTNYRIVCAGFCETYSISNITAEYISSDIVRRVDAMDLLKEKILNVTLTNYILADYARDRHTQEKFEIHYPGYKFDKKGSF